MAARAFIDKRQLLCAVFLQTPLAYMICMVMYWNGVVIGMMRIITQKVRELTHPVHLLANTVFSAAVPGIAVRGAAIRRFASGTRPTSAGTATVLELSSWTFNSPLLHPLHECNFRQKTRLLSVFSCKFYC